MRFREEKLQRPHLHGLAQLQQCGENRNLKTQMVPVSGHFHEMLKNRCHF